MNRTGTIEILNRLVAIHARSFAMYLSSATPWTNARDGAAHQTLMQIVADQKATLGRLVEMIVERKGAVDFGEFPIEFTGTHDLSLEYLLGELIRYQQRDIVAIEQYAEQLKEDPMARSAAQEALGEAKGHLDSLRDVAQQLAGAGSAGTT